MDNTADINYFKNPPFDTKFGETAFKEKLPSILESHENELKKKLIFDKISDAQAYSGFVAGDVVETLGFNTKGDKGAWKYQVTTLVNDGYNITTSTPNLYLNPILSEGLNLFHLGVKADGVYNTINDTAINFLYNHCLKNDVEFYIDKGINHNFNRLNDTTPLNSVRLKNNYKLDDKLTIKNNRNLFFFGDSITLGVDGEEDVWTAGTYKSSSYSNHFLRFLERKIRKNELVNTINTTNIAETSDNSLYYNDSSALPNWFGSSEGIKKFAIQSQNSNITINLKSKESKLAIFLTPSGSDTCSVSVSYDGVNFVENDENGVSLDGAFLNTFSFFNSTSKLKIIKLLKGRTVKKIRFTNNKTGTSYMWLMTNIWETDNCFIINPNANKIVRNSQDKGLFYAEDDTHTNKYSKYFAYPTKEFKNISIFFEGVTSLTGQQISVYFKTNSGTTWQTASSLGLTFYDTLKNRNGYIEGDKTIIGETSSELCRSYHFESDPLADLSHIEAIKIEVTSGNNSIQLKDIIFSNIGKWNFGVSGIWLEKFITDNWTTQKTVIHLNDTVFFNFGMNEWIAQKSIGTGVWRNSWETVIKDCIKLGAKPVLIIPIKPRFNSSIALNSSGREQEYDFIIKEVKAMSEKYGLQTKDLYNFFISNNSDGYYAPNDMVHPSVLGHKKMAEYMCESIFIEE